MIRDTSTRCRIFYRGEMGRIMVWRQRLDITTNWAITSSTAIITIAFSTRGVPHIIFFFKPRHRLDDALDRGAPVTVSLRRVPRARVRMLEAHFSRPDGDGESRDAPG